ncbi:Antiviral helicase ski2 [Malassezia vespertilionis]|nr:Antiviral helicase ski2 [Malassezia vespertilionis]WFD05068.1 Antiviral helicase ski2 [Malassezia vespertilionis]
MSLRPYERWDESLDELLRDFALVPEEDSVKCREEIKAKFLTPKWDLDNAWLAQAQLHWDREPDYENMLSMDPAPSTTSLQFIRSGLRGDVVGYREVISTDAIPELHDGEKLNMSMQRPVGNTGSYVRGASDAVPFKPGGLEDDAVNQHGAHDVGEEPTNLRSVPPGFKHGLLDDMQDDGSWNLNDSVAPLHESGSTDHTVITATADGLYRLPEEARAPESEDAVVDELLPVESIPRMFHGVQVQPHQEKREWAHAVDATRQMTNFDTLVPYMAHQFPFELDTFQKQAVYHLERNESIFVAAHTSAGKTVVAEYAIALAMKHLTRCIYTSPIKALSNQKFREFKHTFGADNVGILTGDVQINPEAPCLIMTTEILRSMLYRGADLIRDVEFVIFDEVHYVNDQERGVVWEEVIILLPSHVNIVLLSATVPNTMEFAGWVGRTKKKDVYVISTRKRPVPLEHFLYAGKNLHKVVDASGRFLSSGVSTATDAMKSKQHLNDAPGTRGKAPVRGRSGTGRGARGGGIRRPMNQFHDKSLWVNLIGVLRKNDLLPVVVFVFSKKKCEEYADSLPKTDLCSSKEKSEVHVIIERSLTRLKKVDHDLPQILRTRDILSRGIGVHHGGLLPIMKELVEILFQRGLVKVLFATETFAMGVNMPARSVVFSGTRKHDGTAFRELLPGEYTQMSGRAGRRGLDATGVVIVIPPDDGIDINMLNKMMLGQSSKLQSQFRITYSMVLNLLRVEALKVEEMIKRSFSENSTQRLLPEQQKKLRDIETRLGALEVELKSCTIPLLDLERLYDASNSAVNRSETLIALAYHHSQGSKYLGTGRVVLLRDGFFNFTPAFIVRQVVGEHFLVLAAMAPDERRAKPVRTDLVTPMWVSVELVNKMQTKDLVTEMREVPLSSILFVTTYVETINAAAIYSRRASALRQALEQLRPVMDTMHAQLLEAGPNAAVAVTQFEADWAKLRRLDFQEAKQARDLVFQELIPLQAVIQAPHFLREYQLMHRRKGLEHQIACISASLSDQNLDLLPDYHQRVDVLKALRFIDPVAETVLLKGRVACEIKSANELILTELILDNTFIEYEPEEIAALLSVFHFHDKSSEEPKLPLRLAQGYEQIVEVADRVSAVQTANQLAAEDDANSLKTGLMLVVYEWAKGTSFNDIMHLTSVGEGIIVRSITRLDETFREIRDASRVIGDMDLFQKMETCQQIIRYVSTTC